MQQVPKFSDEPIAGPSNPKRDPNETPKLSLNDGEYSHYNISVIFDPNTSSVTGNLSVDYYNNDPVSFDQIPFHLFLSGMQYLSRMGSIKILNVQTSSKPRSPLTYVVDEPAQLLWVNLETVLESNEKASFEIEFTSIIPDGSLDSGLDRANSHGSGNNRIYKFTSFYPMPCVYDAFDGWNTDPYLDVGDPFYHDMTYYDLIIEAPNGMKIAATGELIDKINKGTTTVYFFDPVYPVREVTFAASEGYQIQSAMVNGVNVSTYYIPNSEEVWEDDALDYSVAAFNLFNDTFGFYPYSTLNIVEDYASYLGMEYPTQVYISQIIDTWNYDLGTKKWFLEKTITHEIAHQWWYNLVGFDEVDWGFLDEGLTCWSTDYYALIYHGDWEYFQYTKYFDRVRTYYVDEKIPSKINQSTYDLIDDNLNLVYISYYKSPLIFEKISRTLEQSNFLLGLSNFFEHYQFKIALLSDLQDILEHTVNENLDWLFLPWFDNDFLPRYRFSKYNYDYTENTLQVTIEDQNEIINAYPYRQQAILQVYDSAESILYNEEVWINSTTTFTITVLSDPERVRLVYGNDVIVQLSDPTKTYIELSIKDGIDLIPGYNINILLIVCALSFTYLISKKLIRQKN